jgi:hypothetical protein
MDKRKFKRSTKGNVTSHQNKYGSNYRKTSVLKYTNESFDVKPPADLINGLADSYDLTHLLISYEKKILDWLSDSDLPVKGTDSQTLSHILEHGHFDKKGAVEASKCLHEIRCAMLYTQEGQFEKACANALRLVSSYQRWFFAILEPTLSLGKRNTDAFTERSSKLTDAQYLDAFYLFEKLEKEYTKHGHKTRNWKKVIEHVEQHHQVKITDRALRARYKVWKSG